MTVPLVLADSTNEETCDLLGSFLIIRWSFLTVWPLAVALRLQIGSKRWLGDAFFSQSSIMWPHAPRQRTIAFKSYLTCLFFCPSHLSCLTWSWQGCHVAPWRSSVSVSPQRSSDRSCGCTPLHIIAKSLANHAQLLFESLQACNHVRITNLHRREQHLQNCIISQCVARVILEIQSSQCIELHFIFGVTDNFETLSELFHERNQTTMKLHVEIYHVGTILPLSNLLDVRLGNRRIVFVLSPIQDRSCMTDTPRCLNTKLEPQISPSFLWPLKPFILENMWLKVTGIVRRLGTLHSTTIGEEFHICAGDPFLCTSRVCWNIS